MNRVSTANIGSYPRVGEEKDQQRLRRALHHLQYREISTHAFHDVEQSVVQEIIREQILLGIDQPTDGGVSWHDAISHFCRKLAGVKLAGLARYFDTNTYFRVPVFTGRPRRRASPNASDFTFSSKISNRPIRMVMTGPYTLARHSQATVRSFQNVKTRATFFKECTRADIKTLVEDGATIIQIDEPSIGHHPEDIAFFKKLMDQLVAGLSGVSIYLNVFWSPISRLYPHLRELPFTGLNLDFTQDEAALFSKVMDAPPRSIGFGVVDGRTTRPDQEEPLGDHLVRFREKHPDVECFVTPSCGLELLPRRHAMEKLRCVARLRDAVEAGGRVGA